MAGTTLDLEHLVNADQLATQIAYKYQEYRSLRKVWEAERTELIKYVYATDTKTTTNKSLPWANSTTTPKLTQIYDNLKANYEAALFPRTQWMSWVARDAEANNIQKARAIQAYMQNKLELGNFRIVADKLLDDFVLYGNCFATVEWNVEVVEDPDGGMTTGFVGPTIKRISPYDIVFNPTAASFEHTPKMIRSIVSVGELLKMGLTEVHDKMQANRREVAGSVSVEKSEAYVADGFSNIEHYYQSEYVELITFYGDIYDQHAGVLHENRKIVIADRAYVISNEPIASWLGKHPVFHAGWRSRPDNLYAMGPLDNLVGMQYRIDHLENLKADVFDQIAYPMQLIQGDVEDYDYAPGERIIAGEEGNVTFLRPDTTALNADMQINLLENKMEELAGAPRTAMGIRTPGEKTAFEVSSLQNAAGRIFQHKAAKFETEFIEPVLNAMLEAAKRNMADNEKLRIRDPDIGADAFVQVTKEDITSRGHIVPVGARHFAERAIRTQNLQNLVALMGNPQIGAHISGKKIAEMMADLLNEPDLYGENVAIREQESTQIAAQDAEANVMEDAMIAAEEGL